MNALLKPQSGLSDLQLDEALRLLRHAGRGDAFAKGVHDTMGLQAVIDGLCELSSRDGLTGIANQRHFQLVLERELDRVTRTGEPLALLLFDIDHFKQVNDRYGHPVGDIVLKSVAWTLEAGVRPMDTVARCGGEEWAVILPSSLAAHAQGTAERLHREIGNTPIFLEDGTQLGVTVSCGGAAVAPWTSVSPTTLITEADRALYAAKQAGRNRVCFSRAADSMVSLDERAALLNTEGSIAS
ncbi:MAG: GGDEF domain-containing protein [Burkholderiales bacterium]